MKYKDYETYVIGVDHGYNNMKTHNCHFPTRISTRDTLSDVTGGILQLDGKIYDEYGAVVPYTETFNKTVSDDFYHLTLISIAKELKLKNVNGGIVKLAAGLPLRYFERQKEDFKKYLLQKPEVSFKYEGKTYHIFIEDCKVFTQGFAAIMTSSNVNKYLSKSVIICDIGGGTVDYIPFEYGRIDFDKCKMSSEACNWLMKALKEAVYAEIGRPLPDDVALNYILNGSKDAKTKNVYEKVMQKELIKYADKIKTSFAEYGYNIDLTPVVYVGGGASIIKNFGTYLEEKTEFITDLCANAKGYEIIYNNL
jgi:plasmid segregation protein ParM